MKLKTKYGEVLISEEDTGEIRICYNTDCDVMVQVNSTNAITFHTVKPRTNVILSQHNLKEENNESL